MHICYLVILLIAKRVQCALIKQNWGKNLCEKCGITEIVCFCTRLRSVDEIVQVMGTEQWALNNVAYKVCRLIVLVAYQV